MRAAVVAANESSTPSESSLYRVVFEDSSEGDMELPPSLLREGGSEQPELLAAHEWYARRRKMILRAHPELRKLKLLPPLTYAVTMLGLLLLNLSVGATIAAHTDVDYIWLWAVVLSATVGAFAAYGLQQLTHESCHSPRRRANRVAA